MEIQSLSITVPTDNCINNCKFCCSKLHKNPYKKPHDTTLYEMIKDRLDFATNKGVDTIILTSANGEVIQNTEFLDKFTSINQSSRKPVLNIELQTSGVLLTPQSLKYLSRHGVKTISLSISDINDDENNRELCGTPVEHKVKIEETCKMIKDYGFNLRLSLNMTKYQIPFDKIDQHNKNVVLCELFDRLKKLGADQITFRELYSTGDNKISKWIEENKCDNNILYYINTYIGLNGVQLERLSFGSIKYSLNEISVVVDNNCMANTTKQLSNQDEYYKFREESIRYYIIREDGRLYTRWDNKGSLIF